MQPMLNIRNHCVLCRTAQLHILLTGLSEPNGPRGHYHILTDQLTLYQIGGADYAHHIATSSPLTVCSNQHQVQQYKPCLKSFLYNFGTFEVTSDACYFVVDLVMDS